MEVSLLVSIWFCSPPGPPITVVVVANLNEPLVVGQTGNTLTCMSSGTDNLSPTITYQWTRNNGSNQTRVGNSRTLPLSPLRLSNAGEYRCTIRSTLLRNSVSASNTQTVMIHSELINDMNE